MKEFIESSFDSNVSSVILGITLGYTDEISENVRSDFSDTNISHILAVSGMHIGYLALFCKLIFEKSLGKRTSNFFSIIILISYMFLVGGFPSVVRACIMANLMIISKLIYRKSDVWTNLSFSLLMLLVNNPYIII